MLLPYLTGLLTRRLSCYEDNVMKISHEVAVPIGGESVESRANHVEELLDEAGDESFPASDPPAVHPEHPEAKLLA